MSETTNRSMPPGWYPDPEDAGRLRRWDGAAWTDTWMANPNPVSPATPAHGVGVGGPVAGWHLDPYAPGSRRERYWDGTAWTPRLRLGQVFVGRATLGRGFFSLAAWLRGLLWVNVALGAVSAVAAVWVVSVMNRWLRSPQTITESEGSMVDQLNLWTAGLAALALLVTGVLFLVWLARAYGSSRVDPTKLSHGRVWAICCWFVPFANLYYPFAVAEATAVRMAPAAPGAEAAAAATSVRMAPAAPGAEAAAAATSAAAGEGTA